MFLILIITDEIGKAHSIRVGEVRTRCYRLSICRSGRDQSSAMNTEYAFKKFGCEEKTEAMEISKLEKGSFFFF